MPEGDCKASILQEAVNSVLGTRMRTYLFLLLLLVTTYPPLGSSQNSLSPQTLIAPERPVLSRVQPKTGKLGWQAIRIKTSFDNTIERLTKSQQQLLKCVLVSSAVNWITNAIKVHPLDSPIFFERKCQSYFQYIVNGQYYCSGGCSAQTKCGPSIIPLEHLNGCRACSSNGKCKLSPTYIKAGVPEADFVLYVSVSSDPYCRGIAQGGHCQQDSHGRPVGGYLSFCQDRLAYLTRSTTDLDSAILGTLHKLIHILVFSPNLYAFFRDAKGNPFGSINGHPLPQLDGSFAPSKNVVNETFSNPWSARVKINHRQKFLVTPAVKKVVREHFACDSAPGAELEGDGGSGIAENHWEERIFADDTMSFHHRGDERRAPTKLTLALFQDSGWYEPVYQYGTKPKWGCGKGCAFINDSCLGWIRYAEKQHIDTAPFCTESDVAKKRISCSADRKSLAKCNFINWRYRLPSDYQYFSNTTAGGSLPFADFCPIYQPFMTCAKRSNIIGLNHALETFGAKSVCVQHSDPWKITNIAGHVQPAPEWGAGCYNVRCGWHKGQKVVFLTLQGLAEPLLCNASGQIIQVKHRVGSSYYTGSIVCPDIEDVCEDMMCLNHCSGNGQCEDGRCYCYPGYFGEDCSRHYRQYLLDCSQVTCSNGGTCSESKCGFTCVCPSGFTGTYCETDAVPPRCQHENCSGHGVCYYGEDGVTPICGCDTGYTGKKCEYSIDYCKKHGYPCKNGGTCQNQPHGYTCNCPQFSSGVHCGIFESPCSSSPCAHGGNCEPNPASPLGFNCHCTGRWRGPYCDLPRVCGFIHCANGGTCKEPEYRGDTKWCICPPGYGGRYCMEKADPCDSSPCQNGAVCTNTLSGSFLCNCTSEFKGELCKERVGPCDSSPCMNNGTCIESTNKSYFCNCSSSFLGSHCEILNPCFVNPCNNRATCLPTDDGFQCSCTSGWIGEYCSVPNPCTPDPCLNNSTCFLAASNETANVPSSQNASMLVTESTAQAVCACTDGFYGNRCQHPNLCLLTPSPCANNGTCNLDPEGGYLCHCGADYTSANCEVFIPCASNPCENGGTCIKPDSQAVDNKTYSCICPVGYVGATCEEYCSADTCNNGGHCFISNGTILCNCTDGFYGPRCENFDPCLSISCKNGGTCIVDGNQTASCVCVKGYTSTHCETRDPCFPNPCQNGGLCLTEITANASDASGTPSQAQSSTCECAPGFVGEYCTIYDPCYNITCMNDGTCKITDNVGVCQCVAGYTGAHCEQQMDPCDSDPCLNHGNCTATDPFHFVCKCPTFFSGLLCENYTNPCTPNTCLNNGTCVPLSEETFRCTCTASYFGEDCSTPINPCLSQPCLNGGSCVDKDPLNYTCNCPPWYTGERCQIVMNPCDNYPCQNNGTCEATSGFNFTCRCGEHFSGVICEEVIRDPCFTSPCLNGGSCKVFNYNATCTCTTGFTGRYCEQLISACEPNPCGEGNCSINSTSGDIICSCPSNRTGVRCNQTLSGIDLCRKETLCLNNGTCVPTRTPPYFICTCVDQYTGERCEDVLLHREKDICERQPCLNGGTCESFSQKWRYCHCMPGFGGHNCEQRIICPIGVCYNGGSCVLSAGGEYVCECMESFEGQNCERTRKHPCDLKPCIHGECKRHGWTNYTCVCNAGYSGANCTKLNDTILGSVSMEGTDSYFQYNLTTPLSTAGLNITISFRSFTSSGLLFYTVDNTSTWSMSLAVYKGRIQFRLLKGLESFVLVSTRRQDQQLTDGWHALALAVDGSTAMLDVSGDRIDARVRALPREASHLYFDTMSIGDLDPNIDRKLRCFTNGQCLPAFKGYLTNFMINGERQRFLISAANSRGVREYTQDPCGGQCSGNSRCVLRGLDHICATTRT